MYSFNTKKPEVCICSQNWLKSIQVYLKLCEQVRFTLKINIVPIPILNLKTKTFSKKEKKLPADILKLHK